MYINILGINIPSYSFLIILGLIIANIIAIKIIKKQNLIIEDLIILETYSLVFGMVGAKLLYLYIIRDFIQWNRLFEWSYIKAYIEGGFVFYGGLIGGFIGILIAKKIHKISAIEYLSELVFCLPLVHSFGRIGCYLTGCCYGIPYNGIFSVEYSDIPYTLCNVKLLPIQLIEAGALFILAIIFIYISLKRTASIKYIYQYLCCYSILRFILEFFRFDAQRGKLLFLSTSQSISIIILITCIVLIKVENSNSIPNFS